MVFFPHMMTPVFVIGRGRSLAHGASRFTRSTVTSGSSSSAQKRCARRRTPRPNDLFTGGLARPRPRPDDPASERTGQHQTAHGGRGAVPGGGFPHGLRGTLGESTCVVAKVARRSRAVARDRPRSGDEQGARPSWRTTSEALEQPDSSTTRCIAEVRVDDGDALRHGGRHRGAIFAFKIGRQAAPPRNHFDAARADARRFRSASSQTRSTSSSRSTAGSCSRPRAEADGPEAQKEFFLNEQLRAIQRELGQPERT